MRTQFKILFITTAFLFLLSSVSGQSRTQHAIDSLYQVLETAQSDTLRAKVYSRISHLYWYRSLDTAMMYAERAYELVDGHDEKEYQLIKASALNSMGLILSNKKEDIDALKKLIECLNIYTKYDYALQAAYARGNIALIHRSQKDHHSAAEQFEAMRKVFEVETENQKANLAITDMNLSGSYLDMDKLDKALASALEGIKNSEGLGDKSLLGTLKSQAGRVLTAMQRYDEAQKYLEEGLALLLSTPDNTNTAVAYANLAIYADSLGKIKETISYSEKGYEYSQLSGESDTKEVFTALLAESYFDVGQHKKAYFFLNNLLNYRDSVFSEDKKRELHRLEIKQKDSEIALERQEKKLQEASNERKNYIIISIIGALLSAVVLALMFFKGRQKEKQSNKLLQEQKSEILQQNDELHRQSEEIATQRDFINENNKKLHSRNEQITKSIEAAKLIQQAMLPLADRMKECLNDYFVLYKPKDIVSGDFYWVNKVNDVVIIAAVDCTGHGVPGAFMSMIGNLLLENIVKVNKETNPQRILNELNEQTIKALQQENSQDLNGMDISLIALHELENEEFSLHFSGAKRPLYYYDEAENEMKVVKGTNKAIGGRQFAKQFEQNELTFKKGTLVYIGSDGFEDQHNRDNKKIGRLKLLKKLNDIHELPMHQQKEHLEGYLKNHMAGVHQRDDILLIGIKL